MAKKDTHATASGKKQKVFSERSLLFTEPPKKLLEDTMQLLDRSFTKNQLHKMFVALHGMMKSYDGIFTQQRDGSKQLHTEVAKASNKLELEQELAYILCMPENLRFYVDNLSEPKRELWRRVLTNVYVSEAEAKKILGTNQVFDTDIDSRSYYYYSSSDVSLMDKELCFLSVGQSLSATEKRYGYRKRVNFIRVSSKLYRYFFNVFFPDVQKVGKGRKLLPADNYVVCNFESDSYRAFHLLAGLLNTGEIEVKTKGVAQSSIKKTSKRLGLEEFPLDANVFPPLRSNFYVGMLAMNYHLCSSGHKDGTNYEKALRRMFGRIDNFENYLPAIFFPHITGLRRQILSLNSCFLLFEFLIKCLKEEPNDWIGIYDILLEAAFDLSNPNSSIPIITMVFDHTYQKKDVDIVNTFSKKQLAVDSFVMEFGYTLFQSACFMLCSLGMAELALSPLKRMESPFARAEFVRLTPLGQYVLQVTSEYSAPTIEQHVYFELDPDRLIIRSLVSPNPYVHLLSDSATPISSNRFETSPNSFLANCKSRDDIEKKIDLFRQFISKELPPLWKDFFDTLIMHCNPFTVEKTNYRHYRVSPQNAELIRLITSDEQLRKLVVRAEGYLILVAEDDIRKFENQLKKHGYLL